MTAPIHPAHCRNDACPLHLRCERFTSEAAMWEFYIPEEKDGTVVCEWLREKED